MSEPNTPGSPPGAGAPADAAPSSEASTPAQAQAPKPGGKPAPPKKWYIVHTYSGQEARAKKSLLERAATLGFEDSIDEVLIPEENVVQMVGGKKRTSKRTSKKSKKRKN